MLEAAMKAASPTLELRAVSRTFGEGHAQVSALSLLSFAMAPGEFVAVMGPSGSGKSTLLALSGGLDMPSSGEVVVNGVALGSLRARTLARLRRREIGYVFQSFNLLPALTTLENVSLPLELEGVGRVSARDQAEKLLAEIGLPGISEALPESLSGGEQQLVAIARALVGGRALLLADEPTGALDTATGEGVLRVLRARADAGAAVMMVTHDNLAAGWADRIVFLRDGRLVDESRDEFDVEGLRSQAG